LSVLLICRPARTGSEVVEAVVRDTTRYLAYMEVFALRAEANFMEGIKNPIAVLRYRESAYDCSTMSRDTKYTASTFWVVELPRWI
jgi:hypothetical protein